MANSASDEFQAGRPRTEIVKSGEDPAEVITTEQAATLLGKSRVTIDRLRKSGQLQAVPYGRGYGFRRTTVEEYGQLAPQGRQSAADKRGALAAKVFPLLEAGASLAEIVVRLEADPAAVRELFREWAQCRAVSAESLTAEVKR